MSSVLSMAAGPAIVIQGWVVVAPAAAYDGTHAATYADQHWNECEQSPYNHTPPSQYVCLSNNCANFASRSVHSGGYSFVNSGGNDQWYWYNSGLNSLSWSYAWRYYNFLIFYDKDANNRGGGTLVADSIGSSPSQTYNSLAKGDLIFFDWENDGILDHVRVEVGWGTPSSTGWQSTYNNSYWQTGDWADQQTPDRYHDFWNGYWQETALQRIQMHIYQVHIDPLNV